MESSVEQLPAGERRASASQLMNAMVLKPESPARQRQHPSERHAPCGSTQGAGVGHRTCVVAGSNSNPVRGKGDRTGQSRNEKGLGPSQTGSSTYSHPARSGSQDIFKPRRGCKAPAVFISTATTPVPVSHSSRPFAGYISTPSVLVPAHPQQKFNTQFIPRRNQVYFYQDLHKCYPAPYYYQLAPPIPTYFPGFTPIQYPYNLYYPQYPQYLPAMSSSPSTIPSSPTENGNTKDIHQEKLKQICIARGWPEPKYCLVSDRRGGRTAWSCTVHVGSQVPSAYGSPVQGAYQVSARYWYNGHHNAYEDAAEVCFNNIIKAQNAPLSPTPAYHNSDDNNAYAHWGVNRSPTSPVSSPPINPIGLNRSGTFSPGDYPSSNYTTSPPPGGSGGHGGYGAMPGVGMCPGSRNTHSHSQAHASAARGKSYVSSSFGG